MSWGGLGLRARPNCGKCGQAIAHGVAGGQFKIEDGRPVCEACRELLLCAACGKEIEVCETAMPSTELSVPAVVMAIMCELSLPGSSLLLFLGQTRNRCFA